MGIPKGEPHLPLKESLEHVGLYFKVGVLAVMNEKQLIRILKANENDYDNLRKYGYISLGMTPEAFLNIIFY